MRNWVVLLSVFMLAGCAFVFTDVNTRDFYQRDDGNDLR